MKKYTLISLFICFTLTLAAQGESNLKSTKLILSPDEKVWAGVISDGAIMPLKTGYTMDFKGNNKSNQAQPLILTNKGQYIWSEQPFAFVIKDQEVEVVSLFGEVVVGKAGNTLREARKYVADTYFPAAGLLPDTLLFTAPQYNTWIELNFNHNQEDILKYARAIVENGLPTGVLMIDDTWQEDFGVWTFHPRRFPNPKAMIDELHQMGFKVMLWICPFISPDQTRLYTRLKKENALLMEKKDKRDAYTKPEPIMIRWWDGVSAVLDFSNPNAVAWFQEQLDRLVNEYKVDGFKFDAGDMNFYPANAISTGDVNANQQCELYARIGLRYPLNEYRACWKMGGQPLVQRLGDKQHSWKDLQTLIPNMIIEGLSGYPFSCPDMIGGGEIGAFENNAKLSQELIVRSAQCHALMPMMQFSVAPWRVLDKKHMDAVKIAVEKRQYFTPVILQLAKEAAATGEPILRSMEYVFPHQGYEQESSLFMLGDDILVAPVLESGAQTRTVKLPKGSRWRADDGKLYKGGTTVTIATPLERLPYFTKTK